VNDRYHGELSLTAEGDPDFLLSRRLLRSAPVGVGR